MENKKALNDILSGVIFIVCGLAFGYAASNYPIGTALRMGPGYFPLVLAILLCLIGVGVVFKGFTAGHAGDPIGVFPWRGIALILCSLVFFGVTIKGLGLAPALLVTTFLSALASRNNTILGALAIALALTVFCVAIFSYGLGITVPVFGPWTRF